MCMRLFCAVVREGGFSAAARQLGLSKVVVSRSVARLESDLGVRLLQRTTRQMSPTDEGLAYFERSQALLEEFDSLEAAVTEHHGQAKGKLRLAVPSEAFTTRYLLDFVGSFLQRHSDLGMELVLGDRYVDIVDEGFDAAIRIGQLEDSSLIARQLAPMEILLCARPEYLQGHDPITHPQQLADHEFVLDTNYRSGRSARLIRGDAEYDLRLQGRLRMNSSEGCRRLLLQGLGIGIVPSFMVDEELAAGRLVRVLPDWHLGRGAIHVVYSHRQYLSAKVKLLVEGLVEHFQALSQPQ